MTLKNMGSLLEDLVPLDRGTFSGVGRWRSTKAQALLSFLGLTVTAGLVMLAWPKGERAPFVVSFFSPGRSSDLRVVSCFCAFPSGSEKRLHVFSHEGWPFFPVEVCQPWGLLKNCSPRGYGSSLRSVPTWGSVSRPQETV